MMKQMPQIMELNDGSKMWTHEFEKFEAKVYLPKCNLFTDVINYGFMTPYLLVFEEHKFSCDESKSFADESGLSDIAVTYGGSVVFIYPTNEGGWSNAPADLFASIISETKISQYYQDGVAKMRDRFTGAWQDLFIRGALHRSYLYGFGASADYIATNLLQTIEGDGLYGKGDITPTVCILQDLSVIPQPKRNDIPVISVGNSETINNVFKEHIEHLLIKENADYIDDFHSFIKKYRRMVGYLNMEPDLDTLGIAVEPNYCIVPTSADNRGDDKDTQEHKIGYVTYYKKDSLHSGKKLPLVMCFHGGGDSAMCMVALSDWHLVVAKHDFLLVSVENHLNSTATETMSLIEHLKEKYPVDCERIYSTGFSMGGCKSWDMFQEYPNTFAAVAPMDATFDVGLNSYGQPVDHINENTILPVFYVGGEQTPLPELPFQEAKCMNRMAYVLRVNQAITSYDVTYEDKDNWANPIFGIDGDKICYAKDEERNSILTMHLFESQNGCCYSIFASASNQAHEMRHLNCENAWKFFSQFRRLPNGDIEGGNMTDMVNLYQNS